MKRKGAARPRNVLPRSKSVRNVRHKSLVALVLIDVINHFEFPDGKSILRQALAIAPGLARLKERARDAGIPAIYVNDNFGQWRSDQSKLLKYCLRPEAQAGLSLINSGPKTTTISS